MASNTEPPTPSTSTPFELASDLIHTLARSNSTLGVGESLTGGGLMTALTSVPGSSAVFRGGIVSYATPLKTKLLGVSADLIARDGVINADVAAQMAAGARRATMYGDRDTTWGVGTTGVAGPDSQDGKPVGMVYIGIACERWSRGLGPFQFTGGRQGIREATVVEALRLLRKVLREEEEEEKP
ncbi:hypothetical protein F5B19DRAFT_493822 [Rostrohypoxylon terebratum]|nr:hypothetical protein F5B19DRAFT_493822 [Rostrohypoxylon terebratum]